MRVKTIASVDAKIRKTEAEMVKVKARYDELAEELKVLNNERRQLLMEEIMHSFEQSGRSYDELKNFLSPGR